MESRDFGTSKEDLQAYAEIGGAVGGAAACTALGAPAAAPLCATVGGFIAKAITGFVVDLFDDEEEAERAKQEARYQEWKAYLKWVEATRRRASDSIVASLQTYLRGNWSRVRNAVVPGSGGWGTEHFTDTFANWIQPNGVLDFSKPRETPADENGLVGGTVAIAFVDSSGETTTVMFTDEIRQAFLSAASWVYPAWSKASEDLSAALLTWAPGSPKCPGVFDDKIQAKHRECREHIETALKTFLDATVAAQIQTLAAWAQVTAVEAQGGDTARLTISRALRLPDQAEETSGGGIVLAALGVAGLIFLTSRRRR